MPDMTAKSRDPLLADGTAGVVNVEEGKGAPKQPTARPEPIAFEVLDDESKVTITARSRCVRK